MEVPMGVSERRAREKNARREAIIEAAWRVLERTGAIKMDNVAHEAELSKGSLYLYFEDQAALAAALSVKACESATSVLKGDGVAVTAETAVADVGRFIAWVRDHRHAALLMLGEHPATEPGAAKETVAWRFHLASGYVYPDNSRMLMFAAYGLGLFSGEPPEACAKLLMVDR